MRARQVARRNRNRGIPSLWSDDFFNTFFEEPISTRQFLDVYEDDKNVYVEAEVPGFEKESLNIDLQDDILSISGETNEEKEDKRYLYRERLKKAFSRQIRMPEEVDKDEVKASYQNGILTVLLPKAIGKKIDKRIPIE